MYERVCKICLSYMYADKLEGWFNCPSCGFMKKASNSMITMQELLMGRAKFEDLDPELQANGRDLLEKLNKFRAEYEKPMVVSSGLRLASDNVKAGGASKSAHMTLQAADFRDADGKIKEFIANDPAVLERCDLYMEAPGSTPTWIHLSNRKPASGNRIFNP